MLMKQTGDRTADFLIANLAFARRVGDHEHKRDADKWEKIIRKHATPEPQQPWETQQAVENFKQRHTNVAAQ